jgi:hypothetical protein
VSSTIVGLFLLLVPAGVVGYLIVFERNARRRVDNAALILDRSVALPGEEISAHLDLPRRLAGQLRQVTAELVGEEVVPDSSHDQTVWHRYVLERTPLSVECRENDTHLRCRFLGRVPDAAAPTLRVPSEPGKPGLLDKKIRWEIRVQLQLHDAPDSQWEEELTIAGHPSYPSA